MNRSIVVTGVALALATMEFGVEAAPPRKASAPELGVDLVELRPNGPTLRGAVVNQKDDGTLVVAVSRQWMKATQRAVYDKHAAQEAAEWKAHLTELDERIDQWRNRRGDRKALESFLKAEKERVAELMKANDGAGSPPESEFVLQLVPAARIGRVTVQPPARKQIALVAWQEQLPDVETRSVADLERTLREQGIDPATVAVDLTHRLPPQRDSESQWAARQALVEYVLVKPLDYQGTADLLVRTGDDSKPPPLAALTGELLQSQLTKELGDLLGDVAAKKPAAPPSNAKATRAAETEGVPGVRITRMDQNLTAARVTVTTEFLARMPSGEWETVWASVETADASKPRPAAEAKIMQDPQIKQALGLVKSLGLGGEAGDPLTTAVRFGAAVMESQEAADAKFFRFRDQYLDHLEGPPFPWAGRSPMPK